MTDLPDFIKYNSILCSTWTDVQGIMKRTRRWYRRAFYLEIEEVAKEPGMSLYKITLMGPNQKKFGPLRHIPKDVITSLIEGINPPKLSTKH